MLIGIPKNFHHFCLIFLNNGFHCEIKNVLYNDNRITQYTPQVKLANNFIKKIRCCVTKHTCVRFVDSVMDQLLRHIHFGLLDFDMETQI